ncbi:MAG TPA: hypothetical protein ENN18_01575 [Proteobacteria bacterium]|nr:hypothetical protein [Pseudomonadota bacterium]
MAFSNSAIKTLTSNDLWQRVPGNEHVKRALEVALAGSHSVMILGYPETQRPMVNLVQALYERSPEKVAIKLAIVCPCGYFQHPHKSCSCTPREIRHHYKRLKLHRYQIIIESSIPRLTDFLKPGEPFPDVEPRIIRAAQFKKDSTELCATSEALSLIEAACSKLAINLENALQIAGTIAALDQKTIIDPIHLAEAIQYSRIKV